MNFWFSLYYSCTEWYSTARIPYKEHLNEQGNVIVSMTTMPSRIYKTWMVIESILRQTDKPDALILYLSEQEFNGHLALPDRLLKLQKRGLQIILVKDNLRPHNKYVHAMEQFPEAAIVTIDDDKIYPRNLIGNLKKYHARYPGAICAVMARRVSYYERKVLPYTQWNLCTINSGPQQRLMSLGVSGVLLPPGCLHRDAFDRKMLKAKALLTDDLWIKVMALRNHTPVVSLAGCYSKSFVSIKGLALQQLRLLNISKGENDLVFNDLVQHYGVDEELIMKES